MEFMDWNNLEEIKNWSKICFEFKIIDLLIATLTFLINLCGIHLTTRINNVLTILNILVLLSISISGFVYGKIENITKTPYKNGVRGIVKGAFLTLYENLIF